MRKFIICLSLQLLPFLFFFQNKTLLARSWREMRQDRILTNEVRKDLPISARILEISPFGRDTYLAQNVISRQILAKRTDKKSQTIETWVRGSGDYEMGNIVARKDVQTLSLEQELAESKELYDVQYKTKKLYNGHLLNSLLMAPAGTDTAILHFDNRMSVMVSQADIERGSSDPRYALFLATGIVSGKSGQVITEFPSVERKDEKYKDPTPLIFGSNKMVVGSRLVGERALKSEDAFTVWKHTGSLSGIEWVDKYAYENQFNVKGTDPRALRVYFDRCSACHGVKKVGPTKGWDFVHPLAVYEKRPVSSLFMHVKHRKQDPIVMGVQMPHQPDFTREEAEHLWKWLRLVSNLPLKPYRP